MVVSVDDSLSRASTGGSEAATPVVKDDSGEVDNEVRGECEGECTSGAEAVATVDMAAWGCAGGTGRVRVMGEREGR